MPLGKFGIVQPIYSFAFWICLSFQGEAELHREGKTYMGRGELATSKEHDLISPLLYCVLIIEAHDNISCNLSPEAILAYLSLANFRWCPLDTSQTQSTCSPNCTWSGSQGRAGERWISRRSFGLWAPGALWHGRRIHHQRVRLLQ